jgi:hypothetical protein
MSDDDITRLREAARAAMGGDLPSISPHDHPEPQTMVWTDVEIEWIEKYARAAFARGVAVGMVAERDRCVTVCDELAEKAAGQLVASGLMLAIWAIRKGEPAPSAEPSVECTTCGAIVVGVAEPAPGSWDAVNAAVTEYLDGYELRADEGDHAPTEFERLLIEDAVNGLLVDDDFLVALQAAPSAEPAINEKSIEWLLAQCEEYQRRAHDAEREVQALRAQIEQIGGGR